MIVTCPGHIHLFLSGTFSRLVWQYDLTDNVMFDTVDFLT